MMLIRMRGLRFVCRWFAGLHRLLDATKVILTLPFLMVWIVLGLELCLILNPLLDLMFVTIVVFLDTFVLIALSCILISNCPNGHRFPLTPTTLFGELLKALSFQTFQENFNSSMFFSRHTRTRAFSSLRPKTCAVWVRKEPKT